MEYGYASSRAALPDPTLLARASPSSRRVTPGQLSHRSHSVRGALEEAQGAQRNPRSASIASARALGRLSPYLKAGAWRRALIL